MPAARPHDASQPAVRTDADGRPRATLAIVCLVLCADTALYGAIAPLLPVYTERFELSKGGAGVLVAAYSLGMALGALPLGAAAARVGGKRALLAGVALMAVASVVFGLAGSPALLTVARGAEGVGGAAIWGGAMVWLTRMAPPERRGTVIGTALGAALAGQIAGPALGAAATALGPASLFASYAAVVACLGLAAARLPAPRQARDPASAPVRAGVGRRATAAFALGLLVPSMTFGALELLMPLRLHALGAGAAAIGAVFVGMSLTTAIASPWVGRWSDRRGPLPPMRWGVGAAAVLAPALALPASVPAYVAVGALLWLAIVASWTPSMAQLGDVAERAGSSPGVVWGVVNLAFAGGAFVGSAAGGAIAKAAGDAALLGLAGALLAATLAALHAVRADPS